MEHLFLNFDDYDDREGEVLTFIQEFIIDCHEPLYSFGLRFLRNVNTKQLKWIIQFLEKNDINMSIGKCKLGSGTSELYVEPSVVIRECTEERIGLVEDLKFAWGE